MMKSSSSKRRTTRNRSPEEVIRWERYRVLGQLCLAKACIDSVRRVSGIFSSDLSWDVTVCLNRLNETIRQARYEIELAKELKRIRERMKQGKEK